LQLFSIIVVLVICMTAFVAVSVVPAPGPPSTNTHIVRTSQPKPETTAAESEPTAAEPAPAPVAPTAEPEPVAAPVAPTAEPQPGSATKLVPITAPSEDLAVSVSTKIAAFRTTTAKHALLTKGSCNATHVGTPITFDHFKQTEIDHLGRKLIGHKEAVIDHLGNFSLLDLDGREFVVSTARNTTGRYGSNHITVPGMATFASGKTQPVALRIVKRLFTDGRCIGGKSPPSITDVALSLAHLRVWPSLIGNGCCPWPARNPSGEDSVGRLSFTVRPLLRPVIRIEPGLAGAFSLCAAHGWSDRICALNFLHSTMGAFGELLETPPVAKLRTAEFFLPRMKDLRGNASINKLFLCQYCHDPSDGHIMVCDSDQLRVPWVDSGRVESTSSAVRWDRPRPPKWYLVDPVYIVLHTLVKEPAYRYVSTLVPELHPLVQEVNKRHLMLAANISGASQLLFNSVRARLPARPILLPGVG